MGHARGSATREKGATHYAHVFYALAGLTAEKHDSFLDPVGDGSAFASCSGKTLIQGEPDASSFPNGRLRNTFEACGYTGWDVISPAYVLENPNGNSLCVPTVFVLMTGEALDHTTPVLRSPQAMAAHTERILRLFGHDPARVVSSSAPSPPRVRSFDDDYFGAMPERVLGFMMDTEGALQARDPGQDPAQRGHARPVRDRADVRARQRGLRPPAAAQRGHRRRSSRSSSATSWPTCSTRSPGVVRPGPRRRARPTYQEMLYIR